MVRNRLANTISEMYAPPVRDSFIFTNRLQII
jgi:hypothetical protein